MKSHSAAVILALLPGLAFAAPQAASPSSSASAVKISSIVSSAVHSSASAAPSKPATPTSSAPATPAATAPTGPPTWAAKPIVIQHLLENTRNYGLNEWDLDVGNASHIGFDGFGLQVRHEEFQQAQIALAYAAAERANAGVNATRLFGNYLSFDMTSFPCDSTKDAQRLARLVQQYANHSAQFKLRGKPLVGTFGGETCNFGTKSVVEGWKKFRTAAGSIHFVPAFFVDPKTGFNQFGDVIDGAFNYDGGSPTSLTSAPKDVSALLSTLQTDEEYRKALPGKTVMSAITPWTFRHSKSDNRIYSGDQFLLTTRFDQLIAERNKTEIVQFLSWNDFASSNYFGPMHNVPNDVTWLTTPGSDHKGIYLTSIVFTLAFHLGKEVPLGDRESIVLWTRPHAAAATAKNDPLSRPKNAETTQDAVWGLVFAFENSTVELNTSPTNKRTFQVTAGTNPVWIDIKPGEFFNSTMHRNGSTIFTFKPDWTFEGTPDKYNFNYLVFGN